MANHIMKCARCGKNEDRINGYCSVYCEDLHDAEQHTLSVLRGLRKRVQEYCDDKSIRPEAAVAASYVRKWIDEAIRNEGGEA